VRLNEIARAKTFKSGACLLAEGESTAQVFNITNGTVRLSRLLSDGRRVVTGFLFPGDFLGLTLDGVNSVTAEAIGEVEACSMDRNRLNGLFEEIPKLEHRLLEMTVGEVIAGRDHMLLLARKTLRERMASFLVKFENHLREDDEEPATLKLPMARADIADYLGVTVETISRCLAAMAEEGLIQLLSPRRIVLVDRERMVEIAEGEELD
jgi:CRP/FNR family transcriptional regulator